MSVLTLSCSDYTVIYIVYLLCKCKLIIYPKPLNRSTLFITHKRQTKPYNIMETSITVINIPGNMEISVKGPSMPIE